MQIFSIVSKLIAVGFCWDLGISTENWLWDTKEQVNRAKPFLKRHTDNLKISENFA